MEPLTWSGLDSTRFRHGSFGRVRPAEYDGVIVGPTGVKPWGSTGVSPRRSMVRACSDLTEALYQHDPETLEHSRRIIGYAQAVGRVLGLSSGDLRSLEQGVLLHDVGKLEIPGAILQKPGLLSRAEWAIMKRHPRIGYDLVSQIPLLEDAAAIVLFHHEWYNGAGYPYGLREDEIPMSAKICAVVDTLDALTSRRPYRRPILFEDARDYIAMQSGTHFDPCVVDAFLQIPEWEWPHLLHTPLAGSALPN